MLELLTVVAFFAVPFVFVAVGTLVYKGKKEGPEIESEAIGEGKLCAVPLFTELKQRRDYMKDVIKQAVVCSEDELNEKKDGKNKPKKKLKKKELKKQRIDDEKSRQEKIKLLRKEGKFCPESLYVIDFNGNVKASETEHLSYEIDALLEVAGKNDEVVVRLDSPGGMVNAYGLGSSQLMRLKQKGIKLTVCVDEVAASGGYLMASVADKIVAAPFAYIGSIGVVMSLPNFNKVLKKHDIDYEQLTAGRFKRTVTMFGENTDEGREKCREELDAVHRRFKDHVKRFRPNVDIEKLATGEHWLAEDALELGLVDEICCSDDYIARQLELTSGAALYLKWKKEEKNSKLERILKLFSAKTLVKAAASEIDKRTQSSENMR